MKEMDMGWKVAQAGAVLIAGVVTDAIVKTAWKMATGHKPPADDDQSARLVETIALAVVSGVVLSLAKRVSVRTAASWYGGKEKPAAQLLGLPQE